MSTLSKVFSTALAASLISSVALAADESWADDPVVQAAFTGAVVLTYDNNCEDLSASAITTAKAPHDQRNTCR